MEKALAKIIATTAFRSSSTLSEIILVAVPCLPPEEGKALGLRVASIMADISLQIINPALEGYPEIQEEWDTMIEKFGRID